MLIPDLPCKDFATDDEQDRRLILGYDRFSTGDGVSARDNHFTTASTRLALGAILSPGEIGKFDALEIDVQNLSTSSTLVGLTLRHGSNGADASGFETSFSGGREFLEKQTRTRLTFPIESFGFYGRSPNWDNAIFLEIFVIRDRDQTCFDSISIRLFGVHGLARAKPKGPRLSLSGLANVLRHDFCGLTHFSPTGQSTPVFFKNVSPINQPVPFSLADYGYDIPPPHPYPPDSADRILRGTIMGEPISGIPDWNHNPLGAHEWTHFLNRHHFLRPLAFQVAKTGCSRSASFIAEIIDNWILSNPAPLRSNGGAGPTWETLTTAWRLREWLWMIGLAWENPSFSDHTRILMLRSIWEHARSLMDHQGHPNNWIIVESCALAITGLLFPQFREAENWFKVGSDRIFRHVEKQFFADGGHFEISPLYHSICLNSLIEFRSVAAFKSADMPAAFDSRLRKAVYFLASLKRPNGTWPSINDSGGVSSDYSALLRKTHQLMGILASKDKGYFANNSDIPKLEHFPDTGLAIMRSGWGESDNFLIFRSGPSGAAHVHNDNLSLDVCFKGRSGLIDPGIKDYSPGSLTEYYRSARSHNVVLVDGIEPCRATLDYQSRTCPADGNLIVSHTKNLIVAHGVRKREEFEQVGNFHLTRTVIFVQGLFWIIRDHVTGRGRHNVSTHWKCCPSDVSVDKSSMIATISNPTGAVFQILPIFDGTASLRPVVDGSCESQPGWSTINGKDVPSPLIVYSFESDLPKTLFWGLFPQGNSGDFPSVTNISHLSNGEVSISVQHPDCGLHKIRIGCLENLPTCRTEKFISDMVYLEE